MRCCSICFGIFLSVLLGDAIFAQSLRWEKLDRGLVAIRTEQGVFLSWRLLLDDDDAVSFDVTRSTESDAEQKLNDAPLRNATHFLDEFPPESGTVTYHVRQSNGTTQNDSSVFVVGDYQMDLNDAPVGYLEIPTEIPAGYQANDAAVGDLDGDGRFELVVHVAGRGQDNSRGGITDRPLFHAYRLDGRKLWEIDLGPNVREGAHYNPFLVFDFDGDGFAEFVCRTSDGTVDGTGRSIGDPSADWRVPSPASEPSNPDVALQRSRRRRRVPGDVGKILSGPEFLTVFDGRTGAEIDSVTFLPQRAPGNDSPSRQLQRRIWGDDYGNRMDRFLATVAFLDGKHPSIVMSRGYYTRTVIVAWDLRGGRIQKRWVFDSNAHQDGNSTNRWAGQGNHSISVADIDQDGRDEIVFGSMVIDDDGTGLYSTQLGHGDAQHTSDLDPERPGMEIWSIHENDRPGEDFVGSELRDAATGEILLVGSRGRDVARGMAADIDPRYPGCELWGGARYLLSVRGEVIGRAPRSTNMAIWWDGDLLRELLDGVRIDKWDPIAAEQKVLFDGRRHGVAANNGSKNNPCFAGDFLGDWREELVVRAADNQGIRVYVSTIPTRYRQVTLLQDRQYRIGLAWQNVGYNQPPHPSFYLGTASKGD